MRMAMEMSAPKILVRTSKILRFFGESLSTMISILMCSRFRWARADPRKIAQINKYLEASSVQGTESLKRYLKKTCRIMTISMHVKQRKVTFDSNFQKRSIAFFISKISSLRRDSSLR